MQTAPARSFWDRYRRFQGVNANTYAVTSFKTASAVADRLLAIVAAGAKRATAGPMHYFGEGREEPLPVVGEYTVVLDSIARAQLRALFVKMEVRRQADLVRMLHAARTLRLSLR